MTTLAEKLHNSATHCQDGPDPYCPVCNPASLELSAEQGMTSASLDALADYANSQTVDITPPGLKTSDGAACVSRALEAWNSSAHEVANLAACIMNNYGSVIKAAMVKYDPGSHEEFGDLKRAIETRAAKQEEFLRALAGAPVPPAAAQKTLSPTDI